VVKYAFRTREAEVAESFLNGSLDFGIVDVGNATTQSPDHGVYEVSGEYLDCKLFNVEFHLAP
jgi:hypothetical protein